MINREVIDNLIRLQEWDDVITRTEARRTELRHGIDAAQAELDGKKALKDAAHKASQEALAHTHRLEMDVKGKEGEIEKCTVALNTASNNKEYSGLLLKIGTLKAECGKIETEILHSMDAQEVKEREEDAAAAVVKDAEAKLRAAEAKSAERTDQLEQEIEHGRQRREEVAASLPTAVRAIYDRLQEGTPLRGRKVSVVKVKGEYCQGCFMKLKPQSLAELVAATSIVRCGQCSRIVVMDTVPQPDED